MRPSPFELLRPQTKLEALIALDNGAVPLAGGQSLLQGMRLGSKTPNRLVDLCGVAELDDSIIEIDGRISIGAKVTHRQFIENPLIIAHLPWLVEAAARIGDVQVRNLGTVLGNLCWADPRANMAVAMLACDSFVVAASSEDPNATEDIPLTEFFSGYQQNALGTRLACSITISLEPGMQGQYIEFSRQTQDLALCNVCVVRNSERWRVVVGGIADQPLRLFEIEEDLSSLNKQSIKQYLLDQASFIPPRDAFGDRDYKMQLAATLIDRAVDRLRT